MKVAQTLVCAVTFAQFQWVVYIQSKRFCNIANTADWRCTFTAPSKEDNSYYVSTPPTYYHRNLPHWHHPGVPIFFTCRLYGSLPAEATQELRSMQKLLAREISTLSAVEQQKRRVQNYKKIFARIDATLDKATSGPLWLAKTENRLNRRKRSVI
jgi:hypothetical protein